MKKTGKIVAVVLAALLVVAALVVLAACGTDYNGDCHYSNTYGTYGVKVVVTVNGDTITAVKLLSDEESGYTRTTKSWKPAGEEGGVGLGFAGAEAAYDSWISENIVGKTVAEVLAWEVTATAESQTVGAGVPKLVGATQSSARIIAAIQNALQGLAA